jgi:hypothetical protein
MIPAATTPEETSQDFFVVTPAPIRMMQTSQATTRRATPETVKVCEVEVALLV